MVGAPLTSTQPAPLGATAHEWQHFDLVLGLGADMLPVVCDPNAKAASFSNVKAFGKIPSQYHNDGSAFGIAKWTKLAVTGALIDQWRSDPRLGFCVRTSAVRAIDVDTSDASTAAAVQAYIIEYLNTYDIALPTRVRANSPKFLMPFYLAEAQTKRIINTSSGRIEFLADGQQFVAAGTHTSGARYEWLGGLPQSIPTLSLECFEHLWGELQKMFGVSPASNEGAVLSNESAVEAGEYVKLTEIDADTRAELHDALKWPPLLKAAGSNEVWSEIGYSLMSLGAEGHVTFHAFSKQADNYHEGDSEKWWAEHQGQTPRSDYRHIFTLARKLGWGVTAELSEFPITEAERAAPSAGQSSLPIPSAYSVAPAAVAGLRRDESGPIPFARHRCTDQANANRLSAQFGHRLRCIAGSFYWYTGTHWQKNEGQAAWCAANLSAIVHVEAKAAHDRFESLLAAANADVKKEWAEVEPIVRKDQSAKVAKFEKMTDGEEILRCAVLADALAKWEKQCEMQTTQAKALTLLRSLLSLDAAQLDRQHHLINCPNGTVNLITGEIQPHDPNDYITCITPVAYRATAQCPHFEQFLVDILDQERAAFLQRWFGYGITGEVREQKVVLHIGGGGNGKGTLFRLLEEAAGKRYVAPAPPNLFTGSSERHPTEVADLLGKRTVISQESEEGAFMREAFIKTLSGEDEVKARFLFKDFFSFRPTFKLNLSTNAEPNIKGQDRGIWRRIYVVRYKQEYGTAEEVEAGKATRVADTKLTEKLAAEGEGILAWLVRGAREWYAGGLPAPRSVINESALYRSQQDRMQRFADDKCVADPQAWSAFTNAPGALYPMYMSWCKENGYMPMGLNKFGGELVRVIPRTFVEPRPRIIGGVKKMQHGIAGVRLVDDMRPMDDFPVKEANGDLI